MNQQYGEVRKRVKNGVRTVEEAKKEGLLGGQVGKKTGPRDSTGAMHSTTAMSHIHGDPTVRRDRKNQVEHLNQGKTRNLNPADL